MSFNLKNKNMLFLQFIISVRHNMGISSW